MATRNVTHAVFSFPGLFLGETETRVVESRNPLDFAWPLRGDKPAYAVSFFDTVVTTVTDPVSGEDMELTGDPCRESEGVIYRGGKILTLPEVRRLNGQLSGKYDILVSNMEANGYGRVIQTVFGTFQPFTSKDTYLPESDFE